MAGRVRETISTSSTPVLDSTAIQNTNGSSILSKRSVEKLYNQNEPQFLRHFVAKFQRRTPLINRGYWLRMRIIDRFIRKFLERPSEKLKVVINLGCGNDVLPWQSHFRYPNACQHTLFIDVDHHDLMFKKRTRVLETPQLKSLLGKEFLLGDANTDPVLLQSDKYCQLACDLRDLNTFRSCLEKIVDWKGTRVLFVAEASITFMDTASANSLIQWASSMEEAEFCLLEQILPQGPDHPFAKTMLAHFNTLNAPLRSIERYMDKEAQQMRFSERGWSQVNAWDLWEAWCGDTVEPNERETIDCVEPFDDWEDFILFCRHHFVLHAKNFQLNGQARVLTLPEKLCETRSSGVNLHVAIVDNPRDVARRFGNAFQLRNSRGAKFALHMMGLKGTTGPETHDLFRRCRSDHALKLPLAGPPPRACAALVDLGDCGILLTGGRHNTNAAMSDCWIMTKSSERRWKPTWPLPVPLYRHAAVRLGESSMVLVAGGKTGPTELSESFYVFDEETGWLTCEIAGIRMPAAFGSSLRLIESSEDKARGLIFGGIGRDGLLHSEVCEWELSFPSKDQMTVISNTTQPVIKFTRLEIPSRDVEKLSVFGAQVVEFQNRTYVCGGLGLGRWQLGQQIIAIDPTSHAIDICQASNNTGPGNLPFMVGSSIVPGEHGFTILGGGASCFPVGTFWETRTFDLTPLMDKGWTQNEITKPPDASILTYWKSMKVIDSVKNLDIQDVEPMAALKPIRRIRLESADQFSRVLQDRQPVIMEKLDLGSCVQTWSPDRLIRDIGPEKQVVIHECKEQDGQMDFQSKNFRYLTESFESFLRKAQEGFPVYLRALSQSKPTEAPANLEEDFPGIASDFKLPPQISLTKDQLFSSVLRISGRANMWLHYDVMANVYAQIQGTKRLILFPPTDVTKLYFAPGASSSSLNVFSALERQDLSGVQPHEAVLEPGDVLYLPPMWPHTAAPISQMSVAVNVFFRDLTRGYSQGRDVYGNSDLTAYNKGRTDAAKIASSFRDLPGEIRSFYLSRIAQELMQAAAST